MPTNSYRLHYGQSQTPVTEIVPDPSGLYRIAWPDVGLSDLAVPSDREPSRHDRCQYQGDYRRNEQELPPNGPGWAHERCRLIAADPRPG